LENGFIIKQEFLIIEINTNKKQLNNKKNINYIPSTKILTMGSCRSACCQKEE